MILGLLWMALANAGVSLAARAVLRRTLADRPSLSLPLFLLLRLAFIMALVMGAGVAGVLTPAGLGIPGAVLLALLWARGERFDIPWKAPIPPELPRVLIVLGSFLACRSLVLAWLYVPMDGDLTSYHLPKVAEWVRLGTFDIDLGDDPRSWWPAGFELVETWWVVFPRHDALVEMAGLEFMLLACGAVWSLARWLGLEPRGALLASLVVASTPGLSTQSVTCMNDLPAAALVLTAAALIAARAPFGLLVLTGGMAAGLKPTTVYTLPGLLLFLVLVRKEAPAEAPSRLAPRLLALLGAALGAYWYARTWIAKGTPVYGAGTDLNGLKYQQLGFSLDSLLSSLSDLANHRVYDNRRIYHPMLEFAAGWGPAVVACGLPALVSEPRRDAKLRALGAAFAVALVSILGLVLHDNYNLRFILWFCALPALALARAAERAPSLARPAILALAISCLATSFNGVWPLTALIPHLKLESARAELLLPMDVAEDRVGIYGPFTRAYLLRAPDFRREVLTVRAEDPEELEAEMTRLGVRSLFVFDLPQKSRGAKMLEECERRGWLRRVRGVYYLP